MANRPTLEWRSIGRYGSTVGDNALSEHRPPLKLIRVRRIETADNGQMLLNETTTKSYNYSRPRDMNRALVTVRDLKLIMVTN